jgi:chorismate mutase
MIAIRGATQIETDTVPSYLDAVGELCDAILRDNALDPADIISAIFTTTHDLSADFPARIARLHGWTAVPMIGAQEVPVPGSLPRCCRVLLHVDRPRGTAPKHVYLRGAHVLRPDFVRPQ